uniref:Enoyl reductase (ER) domain-containing protein n=1 Tax=Eutreptiella gymnastica TaxID=73025 RepID=A0A7S4FEQ1_9EUGL
MQAVQVRQPPSGRPTAKDLCIANDVPIPQVSGPNDVQIRTQCTAVNRADTMQRRGLYPPPPGASDVLGLEVAGVVTEVGHGVERFKVGDSVMALLPGGGCAEYCVAPQECCIPVPEGMPWVDAAAIPEVFITAYQCLLFHGRLQAGQNVLLHAGASAVGLAAAQICRAVQAQHVITTSSQSKLETCLRHGATHALAKDRTSPYAQAFAWDVQQIVGDRGVDIIVDPVFGTYMWENADVLAVDGTIVVLAMMGGATIDPPVSMPTLFKKRATLKFSTLRSTSVEYKAKLVADFWEFAEPLFKAGKLTPVVDTVLPWTDICEAHEMLDQNRTAGKVVLVVK